MSGFELYTGGPSRRGPKPNPVPQARIDPSGRVVLNACAAHLLNLGDHVRYLTDVAGGYLALRPAPEDDQHAYAVNRSGGAPMLSARAALTHLRRLPRKPVHVPVQLTDAAAGGVTAPVLVLDLTRLEAHP